MVAAFLNKLANRQQTIEPQFHSKRMFPTPVRRAFSIPLVIKGISKKTATFSIIDCCQALSIYISITQNLFNLWEKPTHQKLFKDLGVDLYSSVIHHCNHFLKPGQGAKVGTLGRKNEINSSYVRQAHTSTFGLCFMSDQLNTHWLYNE